MTKRECVKILKKDLKELSEEDIVRINSLLVKLAAIEYENYKNAA
jgi:hypothetical protein